MAKQDMSICWHKVCVALERLNHFKLMAIEQFHTCKRKRAMSKMFFWEIFDCFRKGFFHMDLRKSKYFLCQFCYSHTSFNRVRGTWFYLSKMVTNQGRWRCWMDFKMTCVALKFGEIIYCEPCSMHMLLGK